MNRRDFVAGAVAMPIATAVTDAEGAAPAPAGSPPLPAGLAAELSIDAIAAAQGSGQITAVQLTQACLARIAAVNLAGPQLRAVLETNPDALAIAAQLDRERAAGTIRGPLHGVPILVKDNVETADPMMTTAGSLALEGWHAPTDAPLVARLRAAGAVILGKTNMSEWANFRSTHSISGWSGRGGQARNPYSLARTPSGSSSGSGAGVAANLCAVAIGSETNGSIVSPASVNGIVGIKPTVGLISRRGVIPISHTQDTAGPMARSVRDAAILLGVLVGSDPQDPASAACAGHFESDYVRYLDADGLRGARLGIARNFFADSAPLNRFLDRQVATLQGAGAVIVDPADLVLPDAVGNAETQVLLYEFKADLNAYLTRLPAQFPVRTLADLIRFNDSRAADELPLFDQELLRLAEAKGGLDAAEYRKALALCARAARSEGIDRLLRKHALDAIVTLTNGPAGLIDSVNGDYDTGGCSSPAAIAGYPHVTVPAGLREGLPVGLSFFGPAFSEGKLLRLASGFEAVAQARVPPQFRP
jgi:amidase